MTIQSVSGASAQSDLTLRLLSRSFPNQSDPVLTAGGRNYDHVIRITQGIQGLGRLTAIEIPANVTVRNGQFFLPASSAAAPLGVGTLALAQIAAAPCLDCAGGVYLSGNLSLTNAILQSGAGALSVGGALTIAGQFAALDSTGTLALGRGDTGGNSEREVLALGTPLITVLKTRPIRGQGEAISIAGTVTGAAPLFIYSGRGAVAMGTLNIAALAINGIGGKAGLTGSVGGVSGTLAAQSGVSYRVGPVVSDYKLNGCVIGSTACLAVTQVLAGIPVSAPKFDLEYENKRRTSTEILSPNTENEE